jgi:hopanoid biosynthesis associated RND transporter like protein HpnN
VLGLGALWLAPRWHFDASPLRVRDPGSDAVRTFQELIEGGDVNPYSIDVVAPDLRRARTLAAELAALPTVERAETLADFVPSAQEAKLAILEDANLLLGPALRTDPVAPPAPSESLEAIRSFRDALHRVRFDDALVAEAAMRLDAALERFLAGVDGEDDAALAALEADLVGSVRRGIDRLREALGTGSVRMADLPARLRERLLARDGRARVEVHPRFDLNDDDALRRFVREVSGVAPNATGTAVYLFESGREVLHALRQAFAGAFVLVVLLLWWLWRSVRDAALAIAPLLLAALFTAATSVAVGLPLNFADVIVLPLLLGIGVDSGIHLVQRHRSEGDSAAALLRSSTSRAVLWSALTTIASFGTLGFASHRGMSSLGQLLTLGVALTLACNLLVLPAALALLERRRG